MSSFEIKEIAVEVRNVYYWYNDITTLSFWNSLSEEVQGTKKRHFNLKHKNDLNNNEIVKIFEKPYDNFFITNRNKHLSSKNETFSQDQNTQFTKEIIEKKFILNNLNLTVPKGCIYGLLGPSGCGKTTLLKCITSYIKPDKGTVRVFGSDPALGLTDIPGREIGYMPQDYSLHMDLTIDEVLTYWGRIFRLDSDLIKIKINELVSLMDLPDKTRLVSSLSGGQKRRTSFACSIIHMPKLLILDEPTVGCDPLLRERIWNLLIEFSTKKNITIIITTHYIEEAKRSNFVGFMKKGTFMAENSIENFLMLYKTTSLEKIFYNLCIMDKLRNEKKRKLLLPAIEAKNNSELRDIVNDKKKNFLFYDFQSDFSNVVLKKKQTSEKIILFLCHLRALCIKQLIFTLRKPESAVAQFIVPLIVIMVFSVCIGSLPKGIAIGIFNQEDCTQNNLCLSQDLITSLSSYAFDKRIYTNLTQLNLDAKQGKLFGYIRIEPNFTSAIIDKINFDSDSKIVNQGLVYFHGDLVNSILFSIFENLFYYDYINFINVALEKLDFDSKFGTLPIALADEVFGNEFKKDYSGINAYTGPGLLVIIVYSVSYALTGLSMIIEKSNNLFERNFAAGVSQSCVIFSNILVNMMFFSFDLFILLILFIKIYEIPLKGSFSTAYFLVLLQCLTGLANGLLLSAFIDTISAYAIIGNGVIMTIFIISGALWPIESMPFYLKWLSIFFPSTLPIESLRSILVRGMPITYPIVYYGFFVSILYSSVMILGACIFFKFRK